MRAPKRAHTATTRAFIIPRVHPYSSADLASQLARNSSPYVDPLSRIDWGRLSTDDYWLPPAAISLHGVPAFMALPEAQRRRLSQFEFLHLIEAGLWLEGLFMQRLAGSLRATTSATIACYRLHELREEAGHSLMFMEVMARSGLRLTHRPYGRLWLAQAFARLAPLDSVAFALATALGEEIPDRLNRFVRRHRGGVNGAIAQVCSLHAVDEARHIAFAHDTVMRGLADTPTWRRALLARLVAALLQQFIDAFFFPHARLYAQAGLTPAAQWARLARANPVRHAFIADCLNPTRRHLARAGLDLRSRRFAAPRAKPPAARHK